jgi:hypothetical protein
MAFDASVRALEDGIRKAQVDDATKDALKKQVDDIKQDLKAYERDVVFYRIVVSGLVAVVILIVIAVSILKFNKIPDLDALTSLGGTALGGLVGLFVRSPLSGK